MKTILFGLAALVFTVPALAQTAVPASSKQPQPARPGARAAAPKPAGASIDAMLASINSKLKTAYPAYTGYSNMALDYLNRKLVLSFETENEDGSMRKTSLASDLNYLAEARYAASPGSSSYQISLFCRWRRLCWSGTEHTLSRSDGQPQDRPVSANGLLGSLLAPNEDNAKKITNALNNLFRSMDGQAQKPAATPGAIEDAINKLYANTARSFSDPSAQDHGTRSNVSLRYEVDKVVVESDQTLPNGNVQHVIQMADINDIGEISSQWKDGVGFVLSLQCRGDARCAQTHFVAGGAKGDDNIGPFVVPAQSQNDTQRESVAVQALGNFLNAAVLERSGRPGATPDVLIDKINAMLMKQIWFNSTFTEVSPHLSLLNGKLILEADAHYSVNDGSIRVQHQTRQAAVDDLVFPVVVWVSGPEGSAHYAVSLSCRDGSACSQLHVSDSASPTQFLGLGQFNIRADTQNFEAVRPLLQALQDLLATAKASQPPLVAPTPESTIAYVNSLQVSRNLMNPYSISNVAFRVKNRKVTLDDDRSDSSGFAAHEEWNADTRDLGSVGLVGPFADSGYLVNIYCKTSDPCVTRPLKVTALPENMVISVAPVKLNYVSGIVANDEEAAQGIVKQLETLLKTASDTSAPGASKKAQSFEPSDSSGPSLDETLAYVSSQITPAYSDPNASYSNTAVKYENGRLILECDISWPAQGVIRHFVQSASIRDFEGVYYAFHKDTGVAIWIFCKDSAKCVSDQPHTTTMPENWNPNDAPSKDDHMGWFVVQNVEMAGRVAKALDHLIKIASKENEQADPFK
jgi:hypothetical protein